MGCARWRTGGTGPDRVAGRRPGSVRVRRCAHPRFGCDHWRGGRRIGGPGARRSRRRPGCRPGRLARSDRRCRRLGRDRAGDAGCSGCRGPRGPSDTGFGRTRPRRQRSARDGHPDGHGFRRLARGPLRGAAVALRVRAGAERGELHGAGRSAGRRGRGRSPRGWDCRHPGRRLHLPAGLVAASRRTGPRVRGGRNAHPDPGRRLSGRAPIPAWGKAGGFRPGRR